MGVEPSPGSQKSERPLSGQSLEDYSEKLQWFSERISEAEWARRHALENERARISPSLRWFSAQVSRFGLVTSIILVTATACVTASVICFASYAMVGFNPFVDSPLQLFLPIAVPWMVAPPITYPLVSTIRSLQRLQDKLAQAHLAVAAYERERQEVAGRLLELATTDYLTGLYNRRAFFEAAQREFARARRNGTVFSLLELDLDHFKAVNDTYGHDAGDRALRGVAQVMLRALRVVDLPARLGGEEFAVLLPETDAQEAQGVAERLRQAIASADIQGMAGRFRVTVSIGLATFHPEDPDAEAIVHAADQALYRAKELGRDRVVSAEPR